ncbi:NAD-dependent dehydratase, partial [Streptomyces tendae]
AAVLFADAAVRAGVRRFLVVSSMGADPRATVETVFDLLLHGWRAQAGPADGPASAQAARG